MPKKINEEKKIDHESVIARTWFICSFIQLPGRLARQGISHPLYPAGALQASAAPVPSAGGQRQTSGFLSGCQIYDPAPFQLHSRMCSTPLTPRRFRTHPAPSFTGQTAHAGDWAWVCLPWLCQTDPSGLSPPCPRRRGIHSHPPYCRFSGNCRVFSYLSGSNPSFECD